MQAHCGTYRMDHPPGKLREAHTHTGAAAHTRLVQSVRKTFEDVFGHHKFDSSECSEAHKRLVSGERVCRGCSCVVEGNWCQLLIRIHLTIRYLNGRSLISRVISFMGTAE